MDRGPQLCCKPISLPERLISLRVQCACSRACPVAEIPGCSNAVEVRCTRPAVLWQASAKQMKKTNAESLSARTNGSRQKLRAFHHKVTGGTWARAATPAGVTAELSAVPGGIERNYGNASIPKDLRINYNLKIRSDVSSILLTCYAKL